MIGKQHHGIQRNEGQVNPFQSRILPFPCDPLRLLTGKKNLNQPAAADRKPKGQTDLRCHTGIEDSRRMEKEKGSEHDSQEVERLFGTVYRKEGPAGYFYQQCVGVTEKPVLFQKFGKDQPLDDDKYAMPEPPADKIPAGSVPISSQKHGSQ